MSSQDLSLHNSDSQSEDIDVREAVWDLADSILESGRYPTRNDICQALKKSSKTIGGHFADWRKANPRSALMVQTRGKIHNQRNGSAPNGNFYTTARDPELRESELEAARKVVAKHYCEKTGHFRTPGLQEQVDEAKEQIDEYVLSQQPGPKQMLDWLMNGNQQDAQNQH